MQFSKMEMSCINLGKMVTSNSLHWHKKEESSSKCNSKEQTESHTRCRIF